jgi:hypothetical protein
VRPWSKVVTSTSSSFVGFNFLSSCDFQSLFSLRLCYWSFRSYRTQVCLLHMWQRTPPTMAVFIARSCAAEGEGILGYTPPCLQLLLSIRPCSLYVFLVGGFCFDLNPFFVVYPFERSWLQTSHLQSAIFIIDCLKGWPLLSALHGSCYSLFEVQLVFPEVGIEFGIEIL